MTERDEYAEAAQTIRAAREIVDEQAEDLGLWCIPIPPRRQSIVEAYLRHELRRLHAAVEAQGPALDVLLSPHGPEQSSETTTVVSDDVAIVRLALTVANDHEGCYFEQPFAALDRIAAVVAERDEAREKCEIARESAALNAEEARVAVASRDELRAALTAVCVEAEIALQAPGMFARFTGTQRALSSKVGRARAVLAGEAAPPPGEKTDVGASTARSSEGKA